MNCKILLIVGHAGSGKMPILQTIAKAFLAADKIIYGPITKEALKLKSQNKSYLIEAEANEENINAALENGIKYIGATNDFELSHKVSAKHTGQAITILLR